MPAHYSDSCGRERHEDSTELTLAIQALLRFATVRQTECAIAVSTKDRIGTGTEFEKLVGRETATRLSSGSEVVLKGVRMRLLVKRGRAENFGSGPVLALYMDPTELKEYFEEGRITDLIFVPWTLKDKERFLSVFVGARPLTS